jgi:hypothetical protein
MDKKSSYDMFTIKGDFSPEFLKSIGMVPMEVPLYEGTVTTVQPMKEPVGLKYVMLMSENRAKEMGDGTF